MKTIMRTITIGREFGSGGREVGLKVATALNIPFYDKELISLAAEKGKMSPDFLEEYEESVAHAPFFLPRSGVFSAYQQPMTDKIYLSQFQIIQSLAAKGPCVIVGRSTFKPSTKSEVSIISITPIKSGAMCGTTTFALIQQKSAPMVDLN